MDRLLFEIPLYRLSFNERQKEIEKEKKEIIKDFIKYSLDDMQLVKKRLDEVERIYYQYYRKCWHYNELVWFIRIYTDWYGKAWWILYYLKAKKIRKTSRKEFEYRWKIFEVRGNRGLSNKEIFKRILIELKDLNHEKKLKKIYIDLESFKNIGNYVDWKNLIFFNHFVFSK